MKTQLLLMTLITSVFVTQIQGQNRTIVNAQNSEISDNLDLRVVASVFGDSRDLQDFERRLNDPKLQISNLDLNFDGQVDYLRVIESVQKRSHIVIIQSVLNRDVYQDVATIEIEKNWLNNVHIQVVGNSYFYGQNYIYEPVYSCTPIIYNNFWTPNYRPYYSNWYWNYYPSYYYAWNTYPIYRYRYNVNICLNNYNNNHYNYANHRRSSYYSNSYNNKHNSNGFEKQHPEYSFSRRNATVNNRYELDKIRNTKNTGSRNDIGYTKRSIENIRETAPQKAISQRDYSQNRVETSRETAPQKAIFQRDYTPQRTEAQRVYSQNKAESQRVNTQQRTEAQRDNSQNRAESQRVNTQQRMEAQRDNSQNRAESSATDNNNSSRSNNRRT